MRALGKLRKIMNEAIAGDVMELSRTEEERSCEERSRTNK